MTAQEKQETLQKLQFLTGIFQEFEQACHSIETLPGLKRSIYSEVNVPDPVKSVAGKGSSALATVIAYLILILPSIFASAVVVTLLRLPRTTSVVLLIAIVINVIGAKLLGDVFSKKLRAGGSKLQDTVNQQIRNRNEAAAGFNDMVDRKLAEAEQKCEELRQRMRGFDMSWYLPDYCFSDAAAYFYKAVNNDMCQTLGEAAKMYDEVQYRNQVLANQQKQTSLMCTQCLLQGMTIQAIYNQGAAIQDAIHSEGAATRETIWQSGEQTRQTIQDQGAAAWEQQERHFKEQWYR